jgi:hypothetical protein
VTPDSFRAELEADQLWRTEEMRFLQNQCSSFQDGEAQKKFRRLMVVALYANFEGFCKFALTLYAQSINHQNLKCNQVVPAIAAASLSPILQDLRNPEKKHPVFKNDLPDDTKLHRFARDHEFIERAVEFLSWPVQIPDDAINTESNLNPAVLRKCLYQFGLPYEEFRNLDGDIHQLLNARNKIAHGVGKGGIEEKEYLRLREAAMNIMNGIKVRLTEAFVDKAFLRRP